ncbi:MULTISPECIES: hypothetical protein [Halorussus]|uniref:hypothetical protein n=1 Tax=Halorussus TaxID=1070314 RepID=UPI0013B44103|nr:MULTISPECIES: hypothetical protein [Halorussus]NHN58559.1 hypothetical protein [Halorussus sp. JP-T4]
MVQKTPRLNLYDYEQGDTNWDHSDLVNAVDEQAIERGPIANRPSSGDYDDELYYATNQRIMWRWDSSASGWIVAGGTGTTSKPLPEQHVQRFNADQLSIGSDGPVGDFGGIGGGHALSNGKLVAITDGERTVVNPNDTTTPVQDACDIAMSGSQSTGTVLLPPTTIQEAGDVSFERVRLFGHGTAKTKIEFTHGGDGLVASSTQYRLSDSFIDGVNISGQSGNELTNAIHWDDDAGPKSHIGRITLSYYQTGVKTTSDAPWGSHWHSIYGGTGGTGKTFHFTTGGMTDMRLDQATIANTTQSIGFHVDGGAIYLDIGTLQFERDMGQAMQLKMSGGMLNVNQIGYENNDRNDLTGTNKGTLVDIVGNGNIRIGQMRLLDVTVNYPIECEFNTENVYIGTITTTTSATIDKNYIAVEDDLESHVIYEGTIDEVDNNTGSTLSNPVVCLGDMSKKKSTGTGYDGGTDDSRL